MSAKQPNIVFIMSDDHAAHAMSCYDGRINQTPNMDRIANEGMLLENCFCTNSICTPSRAVILTGTYNHINKVYTLATPLDNSIESFPGLLQKAGYQTGMFGKWHLGKGPEHCPAGFDEWAVLPGQGLYENPHFIFKDDETPGGKVDVVKGYVTDIIGDMSVDFIKNRDPEKPFCLCCHHKAPHRPWVSDEKHADMYLNEDIREPDTLYDTYEGRTEAAHEANMRVGVHMNPMDVKRNLNHDLPEMELRKWAYQYYIKDYLRVIASVDDNIGKVLDELDTQGIADDTIVIYTSDQGFFLGDHGWFDKRFMYEESLRMPFVIRYPQGIKAGTKCKEIAVNVDFAKTFLDYAGVEAPDEFQGTSLRSIFEQSTPDDWQKGMYYRYWMHDGHHKVRAHYGLRTMRYKLICFYNDPMGMAGSRDEKFPIEWELFDLDKDPQEMNSVYDDPEYADIQKELKTELYRLQAEVGDERHPEDK